MLAGEEIEVEGHDLAVQVEDVAVDAGRIAGVAMLALPVSDGCVEASAFSTLRAGGNPPLRLQRIRRAQVQAAAGFRRQFDSAAAAVCPPA